MTDYTDSPKPIEPRRTAAVSSGQFEYGSVFRLVREIRGSAYSVGDQFMLIEESDCHNPHRLILGGVGETCFIDPRGRALKIEAGDTQIDSIFEFVETPDLSDEAVAESAPVAPTEPKYISEEQFKTFREGLAQVLKEIAASKGEAVDGERGGRGPRGFTGVQGDKGDVGPQGPQGEKGDTGEKGEKGDAGEHGPQGERGEKGDTGERGEPGPQGLQGERGEKGEKGDAGERGEQGEKGDKGDRGEAGPQGPRGERGERGPAGADGRDGVDGARGEKGERGEIGPKGADGKAGPKGAKGEKGDKGDTGESGVVTAKFPLVYDAEEKSIAIDEERLDRVLKKIMGGGKVSAADMGWLASTGGGGKVAIYHDGVKVTPDVRGLDFTGTAVQSITKNGGKLTITLSGGVNGVTGPTGPTGPTGAGGALGYYGVFVSGVSQSIGQNTSTAITYNTTEESNGIYYAPAHPSRIYVTESGTYNFQFSLQLKQTSGTKSTMSIWFAVDGANIADSNTHITLDGNANTEKFAAWNYVVTMNAGQYFELLASCDQANAVILAEPADTNPDRPSIPSVIMTATQVMYTQVGPTGPTGPTGPMPTDYVSAFNGVTGAVQGVSSFQGKTGAVGLCAGAGITHSLVGNTYTFSLNYLKGAQSFVEEAATAPDYIVFQKKPSGNTAEMRITTVQNFLNTLTVAPTQSNTIAGSNFLFYNNDGSQSYVQSNTAKSQILADAVTSFNGLTGAVQGVSSANGLTGAVTFLGGQGITNTVNGNTVTFSINYLNGGATFPSYSGASLAGTDILLQRRQSGAQEMYTSTVQNFMAYWVPQFIPTPVRDSGPASGSYSFLMTGGAGDVETDISSTAAVISPYIPLIDGGTFV